MSGKFDTGTGAALLASRSGLSGAKKTAGDFGPTLPKINVLGLIDISKKKIPGGVPVQYLRQKGFSTRASTRMSLSKAIQNNILLAGRISG
ncbi:MAG TPA: hypothetical protein VIW80_20030 [Pyrinomonadaceae bacterium]